MFKQKIKKNLLSKIFLSFGILFLGNFILVENVSAATYYVRSDGGTAEQCTGLVDAPYSGSGTGQDCAWNHYYEAMPPQKYTEEPRINGGDTLIIKQGEYMHGPSSYYNGTGCSYQGKYQCSPKPIPSGPDANHPTRILGEGWDTGCQNPPELWGTEMVDSVIDLTNSSNVEVQCLELTDHESCGFNYKRDDENPLNCNFYKTEDSMHYGKTAKAGIFSGTHEEPYNTSSNVLLKNLNIHGIAGNGISAAHLTDWTIENCKINYNGMGGFNGDVTPSKGENDAFSGTMIFKNTDINWNGCIEDWQNPNTALKCYDEQEGGYGDGLGTGPAGGATWVLDNVTVNYNTSDGVDLLYTRYEEPAQVKITGLHTEGNAGNALKTGSDLWLENSVLIGNCDYWYDKPFNENISRCRGNGSALTADLSWNAVDYIVNNIFTGEASVIITVNNGSTDYPTENGHFYFYNNLLQGLPLYADTTRLASWQYAWQIDPSIHLTNNHWFIYNASRIDRYNVCNTPGTTCQGVDPLLVKLDPVSDEYNLHFASASSPAIGTGMTKDTLLGTWGKFNEEVRVPSYDKDGNVRPVQTSFGAYEYIPSVRADVDQNSIINSIDAMLTLRRSLGLDMSATNWFTSSSTGDVNCDGTTNSTDAMLILRHSLGLSMSGTGWCE